MNDLLKSKLTGRGHAGAADHAGEPTVSGLCEHTEFRANVDVSRLLSRHESEPPIGYSADITVKCAQCGQRFRWNCPVVGMLPGEPTVSMDGYELRAPLRPSTEDDDFGLGLLGFRVKEVSGG